MSKRRVNHLYVKVLYFKYFLEKIEKFLTEYFTECVDGIGKEYKYAKQLVNIRHVYNYYNYISILDGFGS